MGDPGSLSAQMLSENPLGAESVCSLLLQKSESGSPQPVIQHEWDFFRVLLSTWLPLNVLRSGEKIGGVGLVVQIVVSSQGIIFHGHLSSLKEILFNK